MKLVILFALFAFCRGEYPAALPEVVTPSDSYGPPPEAPADSYGPPQTPSDSYGVPVTAPVDSYAPPTQVTVKIAPVHEALPAPAPEPIITETVAAAAAAPANSASFNFLSELAAQPLVTLGVPETNLKTTPVVQEAVSAPVTEEFQLNIPGLVPPITSIPLPPILPPVQVLPPALFPPPQTSVPVPIPVQPAPIQPVPVQPLPVQTPALALEANPAPAPVTKITAQVQDIPLPRVQTAFIPQQNYQYVLPSITPFSYAPYFFHANTLPATLFPSQKILPQLETSSQIAAEVLNLQPETLNTVVETATLKASPTLIRVPATRYGTPILESLNKKK